MKIKTRLQIAVISALIISVTVGLFIFSAYREMNECGQKEIATCRVSQNMAELKIVTHEYLLHPGERSLMQWKANRDSLAKLLAEETNIFEDSGEKDALKKTLKSLERFSDIFAELAAIPGEEREYGGHHKNGISKLKVKLTGDLLVESQVMVSRVFRTNQVIQAKLVSIQQKTGLLIVILFIFLAGLVSAISLWISRSIGAPITKLEEGIRIIGGGDLNHRVGTDAKDEIGQLSRAFDGMMEDLKKSTASIDDLNREIDARKKTEAALQESEVRFRELFENMRSGVAVYEVVDDGKDFVFKDFNKGAEKIDGVSREAVVGKRVTEVFLGVKESGIFKVFQRVWQTGKPEHFPDAMYSDERITGWRENYVYKLPSGEVVAIYDDITERKRAEQQLSEHLENLEAIVKERTKELELTLHNTEKERDEIDRMKTELISTAAHELKTPLTSIQGYSELLLSRDDIQEKERKEFLTYINDRSRHLTAIIDDMLYISGIESSIGIQIKKEPVDMTELIRKSVSRFQERYPDRLFKIDLPEEKDSISLDREKMGQVLENLLSNAVKFSFNNTAVTIRGEKTDEYYQVFIEDEGIGMTTEQADKIFDKFYRADMSSTAVEGTGLGMTIVKYIIESHNGTIHVKSRHGKGTKVTFIIPT